jgi:hypothetical protein
MMENVEIVTPGLKNIGNSPTPGLRKAAKAQGWELLELTIKANLKYDNNGRLFRQYLTN